MKMQIARMSPHQNGKVIGVLMATTATVIFSVFAVVARLALPAGSAPSLVYVVFGPAMYLIFGYVFTAMGCGLYNFVCKYVGGIEYEAEALTEDRLLD